jgi:hypothetical protein
MNQRAEKTPEKHEKQAEHSDHRERLERALDRQVMGADYDGGEEPEPTGKGP